MGGSKIPIPTDGLIEWLKLDTGLYQDTAKTTPAVSTSDRVRVWADSSGNGNDSASTDDNKRPYIDTFMLYGKRVVRFSAGRWMKTAAIPAMDSDKQTVFIVFFLNTLDQPGTISLFGHNYSAGATSNTSYLFWTRATTTNLEPRVYTSAGIGKVIQNPDLSPNLRIMELRWKADNSFTYHDDGVLIEPSVTDGTSNPSGHVQNVLGADPLTTAAAWEGYVGEKITYNRELTDAECDKVRNYLLAKFTQPFKRISIAVLWSGAAPLDWYGRPHLIDNSGTWISSYVVNSSHSAINADSVANIHFSVDEGTTWTAANVFTDDDACTGFPLTGHDTNSVGSASLVIAPNGDILCHSHEKAAATNALLGTYQYRSTDGGKTWTDEGIINTDAGLVLESDYFISGTNLYACAADFSGVAYKSMLYVTADNGTNWTSVSDATATTDDTDEWGVVNYTGNNLLGVFRNHLMTKTYMRLSTDLGSTWGTLQDITAKVGIVHRPRLKIFANEPTRIYMFGRYYTAGYEVMAMWYTDDLGINWSAPFNIGLNTYADCGYCDCLKLTNNDFYVLGYLGTVDTAKVHKIVIRKN